MWFWASEAQQTSVFTMFLASRVSKKRVNITYLTIFGHYEIEKKNAGLTTTTTRRRRRNTRTRTRTKMLLHA
jgi:hypothetical protein